MRFVLRYLARDDLSADATREVPGQAPGVPQPVEVPGVTCEFRSVDRLHHPVGRHPVDCRRRCADLERAPAVEPFQGAVPHGDDTVSRRVRRQSLGALRFSQNGS